MMTTARDEAPEAGEPAHQTPFSTAGLIGDRAVFASRERPVLDRSFNSLAQTAKIRLSGFNPCLQDPKNALCSERLLVKPWWGIHRDALQSALYTEMSRLGTVVAVEVAAEPKTVLKRMQLAMGTNWTTDTWRMAFLAGDSNNDGTLDRQELRRLLSHFNLELSDLEFNDIWAMVDVGGDPNGTVDFWELVEAFRFDDFEEEVAQHKRRTTRAPECDVRASASKRSGWLRAPDMTGDYPVYAHVTFASAQQAQHAVAKLDGKRIVLRDEYGAPLSSIQAIARGMLPLGQPARAPGLPSDPSAPAPSADDDDDDDEAAAAAAAALLPPANNLKGGRPPRKKKVEALRRQVHAGLGAALAAAARTTVLPPVGGAAKAEAQRTVKKLARAEEASAGGMSLSLEDENLLHDRGFYPNARTRNRESASLARGGGGGDGIGGDEGAASRLNEPRLRWRAVMLPPRGPARDEMLPVIGERIITELDERLLQDRKLVRHAMRVHRELSLLAAGDWQTAEAIVNDMLAAAVPPRQRTLELLLHKYMEANAPQRAEIMLERLAPLTELRLVSSDVLSTLVESWGNGGRLRRATEVVRYMEGDAGPAPSVRTYEALAQGFHRNQEQQLRQQLVEHSQTLAESLLRVHRHRALMEQLRSSLGENISSEKTMLRLGEVFQGVAGDIGITDIDGVEEALQNLGVPPSALLQKYLRDADANGDGSVDFGEFVHSIKYVVRVVGEVIQEAEQGDAGAASHAREAAAREASKHPLTARLAQRRAGWVPSFFWRFDSIRNALSA